MKFCTFVILCAAVFSACGGGEGVPNRAFGQADGGVRLVLFDDGDKRGWLAHSIVFPRIAIGLDYACGTDVVFSSGGRFVVGDAGSPMQWATPAPDGGVNLSLSLSPPLVDSQYRSRPSNKPATIVGTVSATFAGHLSSVNENEHLLLFTMTYRDDAGVLGMDEGAFILGDLSSCQ